MSILGFLQKRRLIRALYIMLVVLTLGLGIQAFVGPFDIEVLRYPVNLYLLLIILIFCVVGMGGYYKSSFFRYMASADAALTSLFFLGVWSLVLGFTAQDKALAIDIVSRLGWRSMTNYWPFVLAYGFVLLALLCICLKRLKQPFSWVNLGFLLNHWGALVVMICLGLGASDSYESYIRLNEGGEGVTEFKHQGQSIVLPFEISLDDFFIDEYMPKCALVSTHPNGLYSGAKFQQWDIDTLNRRGQLGNYQIILKSFLPKAQRLGAEYVSANDERLPPAALVHLTDIESGQEWSAWISSGNKYEASRSLPLGQHLSLVMRRPEPRFFCSQLSLRFAEGRTEHVELAVNKPLRYGDWMMYQAFYDERAGKYSDWSGVRVVYEPWQGGGELGLWMLLLGSVFLLLGKRECLAGKPSVSLVSDK